MARDERKNVENRRKRGLSFEEAQQLFISGVDYLGIFDEAHSEPEDRFIAHVALSSWSGRIGMMTSSESSALVGPPREKGLYRAYLEER